MKNKSQHLQSRGSQTPEELDTSASSIPEQGGKGAQKKAQREAGTGETAFWCLHNPGQYVTGTREFD